MFRIGDDHRSFCELGQRFTHEVFGAWSFYFGSCGLARARQAGVLGPVFLERDGTCHTSRGLGTGTCLLGGAHVFRELRESDRFLMLIGELKTQEVFWWVRALDC